MAKGKGGGGKPAMVEILIGTAQVSVKMGMRHYTLLKRIARETGKTHREILLEGFELFLKHYGYDSV